jgi:hypothetical protein
MALVDRAARARETVHIYGDTTDEARAQVVWTQLQTDISQLLLFNTPNLGTNGG